MGLSPVAVGLLAAICGAMPDGLAVPDFPRAERLLAGSYQRGDGLRNRVTVRLRDTGLYSAERHGCVLEPGTARGAWSVSGTVITLNPSAETGSLRGHLRQLHLVRKGDGFVLVPDFKDEQYRKSGVDRVTAYHKLKPKPGRAD